MTSDAVKSIEPPSGLQNYWYIACPSRTLGRRPVAIAMMSKNIVLFRAGDGSPVALENRCAHRGMPLADGAVVNGTLRCAYHGWCYDRSGLVVDVPSRPKCAAAFSGDSVKVYGCTEQDGYVWLCPGDHQAQDKPQPFPNLGSKGWSTFRMYNRFEAPVESCLENFLDCPHATFVHRSWFRSPTNREVRCRVSSLDDGAIAEYFDEPRERSLVWSLLSPSRGEMRHTDRFVAPSTTRVDYDFSGDRHYTITSSCTPVNEMRTDVYTVITFRYGMLTPLIRPVFELLSRRIIAQDVRTLRRQQLNLAEYEQNSFRIIEQDVLLPHIRRWRASLAQGRQPTASAEATDVRIVI